MKKANNKFNKSIKKKRSKERILCKSAIRTSIRNSTNFLSSRENNTNFSEIRIILINGEYQNINSSTERLHEMNILKIKN